MQGSVNGSDGRFRRGLAEVRACVFSGGGAGGGTGCFTTTGCKAKWTRDLH